MNRSIIHISVSIILPFLMLLAYTSYAQNLGEICDNGIDDDGDGLIDLLDDECECEGANLFVISSHFPNPSFEEGTCAPTSNCEADDVVGWINPSQGSPDYWINCNSQNAGLPLPPCPVPDGEDCLGILNGLGNTVFKEYVGTILNTPLETGKSYTLSFWVGFLGNSHPTVRSAPLDLVVFGNTDLSSVQFLGKECPLADVTLPTPWEELGMTTVQSNNFEWKQFEIDIIPTKDYLSVVIGPSCAPVLNTNYYFIDNMILTEQGNFVEDVIIEASGHACNDDLILAAPYSPHLDYQWYKDGIAIPNTDSSNYLIMAGDINKGDYQVRVNNSYTCTISAPFPVDYTRAEVEITAPQGLCLGVDETLQTNTNFDRYIWSNGDTTARTDISTANAYQVTVTDVFGCKAFDTVEVIEFQNVQFHLESTNETAPGALDGAVWVVLDEVVNNTTYLWSDFSQVDIINGLAEGDTVCVTVDGSTHCPVDMCWIVGIDIQPIVIRMENKIDVRCFEESNAEIHLSFTGGLAPFTIVWDDHLEFDGMLDLVNIPAGNYTVRIEDSEGRRDFQTIEILEPALLEITTDFDHPNCFDSNDGFAEVTNVSGGNGNHQFFWNKSTQASTNQLLNLDEGQFNVAVIDDKGCIAEAQFEITEPELLTSQEEVLQPYCDGADDGHIIINQVSGGFTPYDILINGNRIPGDGLLSDLAAGTYDLEIRDANNCLYEKTIVLNNQATFSVDIGTDLQIHQGEKVKLESLTSHLLESNEWRIPSSNKTTCKDCDFIIFEMQEAGDFILNAMSIEGCIQSDSLYIDMLPSLNIYIPNAISPNNDGVNDKFEIFNAGSIERIISLQIFNSQGNRVYQVQDIPYSSPLAKWLPENNEQSLMNGVYVYTLTIEYDDGSQRALKGDFSIIR